MDDDNSLTAAKKGGDAVLQIIESVSMFRKKHQLLVWRSSRGRNGCSPALPHTCYVLCGRIARRWVLLLGRQSDRIPPIARCPDRVVTPIKSSLLAQQLGARFSKVRNWEINKSVSLAVSRHCEVADHGISSRDSGLDESHSCSKRSRRPDVRSPAARNRMHNNDPSCRYSGKIAISSFCLERRPKCPPS